MFSLFLPPSPKAGVRPGRFHRHRWGGGGLAQGQPGTFSLPVKYFRKKIQVIFQHQIQGFIKESKDIEELAKSVKDTGGVHFVPA